MDAPSPFWSHRLGFRTSFSSNYDSFKALKSLRHAFHNSANSSSTSSIPHGCPCIIFLFLAISFVFLLLEFLHFMVNNLLVFSSLPRKETCSATSIIVIIHLNLHLLAYLGTCSKMHTFHSQILLSCLCIVIALTSLSQDGLGEPRGHRVHFKDAFSLIGKTTELLSLSNTELFWQKVPPFSSSPLPHPPLSKLLSLATLRHSGDGFWTISQQENLGGNHLENPSFCALSTSQRLRLHLVPLDWLSTCRFEGLEE